MHRLWSGRTECCALEIHGESDSDNVCLRTDVDGMAAFPGGWGRFHVKPEENRLRPALVHHLPCPHDVSTHVVCSARVTAGLPAFYRGDNAGLSPETRMTRYSPFLVA